MQCGLATFLFFLHQEMMLHPLSMIGLSLPHDWGATLGWCLAILPLTPILVAAAVITIVKLFRSEGFKVFISSHPWCRYFPLHPVFRFLLVIHKWVMVIAGVMMVVMVMVIMVVMV